MKTRLILLVVKFLMMSTLTYRFEDDKIILHSNSENIDRMSRVVTLQKDLLIFEDEIGVELTMDRGKKQAPKSGSSRIFVANF